jgi:AcrR family transcriptional regulator
LQSAATRRRPWPAIAAEAQVGKHTIYRRYPDKAALFRACIERTADCIIEARSGSAAEAGDPLVTLRQVMMRAALVATDPQMIALVQDDYRGSGALSGVGDDLRRS